MTSLSTGARYLKRGDTFDPEDHRMTYRLRIAHSALAGAGVKSHVEHQSFAGGPASPADEYPGGSKHQCSDKCVTVWPEWVTDEMFNSAFRLADAVQTARAGFNREPVS